MFGTAVGNFADYPDLLQSANQTYDSMRESFANLANDPDHLLDWQNFLSYYRMFGLQTEEGLDNQQSYQQLFQTSNHMYAHFLNQILYICLH